MVLKYLYLKEYTRMKEKLYKRIRKYSNFT